MLILAGVSINAIVGENGVLTKAQNASIESKKAGILEAIDLELASYNIDTILNKPEETSAMLNNLMSKGLIDTVLSSTGDVTDASQALAIPQFDDKNNYTGYTDYGVTKEDYKIILSVDTTGIYKAKYGEVKVSSGGSVAAGTTVVTGNAFNSGGGTEKPEEKGKFTIDNDASVMFVDEIEGELSIHVKSGTHAKVNIFKNMTLTNEGVKRSAIDIEPGGILDLWVAEGATVTVNSGFGEGGEVSSVLGKRAEGGPGGYAGIHVPYIDSNNNGNRDDGEFAVLNLHGGGKVIAIGGNAGNGGECVSGNVGGGGGGGAGAGIGGNGGVGGSANTSVITSLGVEKGDNPLDNTNSGFDGKNGENAGQIGIYDTIIVYAYGGDGGSGGTDNTSNAGGGGGGYPAAGIGGGGAGGGGGNHVDGAGGFSGGGAEQNGLRGENGLGGGYDNENSRTGCGGGGYYTKGKGLSNFRIGTGAIGGMAGYPWSGDYPNGSAYCFDISGNGGKAGSGGKILYANASKIFAYNGDMITNGDYDSVYYEYNVDGSITNKILDVCEKPTISNVDGVNQMTNKKFIPAKIFAQSGIIRATYTTNSGNWTLSKIKTGGALPAKATKYGELILITATETTNTNVTEYTNGYMDNQGIGSGAGYLEADNGFFEVMK